MITAFAKRFGATAFALLAITMSSFAQSASGNTAFVTKLLVQLQQDGWSPAASAALGNAASRLDWSGTDNADPQVVALALEYGASHDAALTATAQAQIALQLALSSVEMEKSGLSQQSAAVAALTALQSSLAELQAAIANHTPGSGVGDIIGKAVSNAVRDQVQSSIGPQINAHSSVGQGLAPNAGGSSYGPPSGAPGASSGNLGGSAGQGAR